MSFTDEELRIIKSMTETADWPISSKSLAPLLARLEAAEKALYWSASMAEEGYMKKDVVKMLKDFVVDLKAWRKACGK